MQGGIFEVYVNDLIILRPCSIDIKQFKEEMKDMCCMSDLGLLSYYRWIEVHQSTSSIFLS
jgi:hypothetical protein